MVLVVIRDAALRRIVARLVRRSGFGVVAVEDFAHARILTLGAPVTVGAVVADLPADEDGIAGCAAALRLWHSHTPTILLTNLISADERFAGSGFPPIDWIEKPFAEETLHRALARALPRTEPVVH